jgi:sigma-B regulation protein RsbU (phosphoserine phosphatase)
MEIYVMEGEQQATLTLRGRFDLQGHQKVRNTVEELVAAGRSTLTFDLSGVSFIDSSAVGLLFLAKETCEKAGGSVRLSCPREAVDRVLKLCRLDEMFRIEREQGKAETNGHGGDGTRKVLVVDGSEDKRFMLASLLTRHRFQVEEADNGQSLLQRLERDRPDLILLDAVLPGELDGIEVCRRLKADPRTAGIPVLFVTKPEHASPAAPGLALGTEDFIAWPVEPTELLTQVKSRLFASHRATPTKRDGTEQSLPAKDAAARKKEAQAELEKARLIQARFFPETFPLGRGLAFAGRHRPSQKIGGDLFDVQKAGEERLAFMIADVSGHGVAAALLTGMTKVLFQNAVQQCEDPGLLLGLLNEEFLPYCNSGEFLTMFVGMWDPKTHKLLYSGAGHPPVYAISADGARMACLEGKGGVLGVSTEARFLTMDIQLRPKQRLILYTDGVTEQSNPQGELYGEKRLTETCASWATLPLDAVVELIYGEVDKFAQGEPQTDDQALLLVEVTS